MLRFVIVASVIVAVALSIAAARMDASPPTHTIIEREVAVYDPTVMTTQVVRLAWWPTPIPWPTPELQTDTSVAVDIGAPRQAVCDTGLPMQYEEWCS